MDFHVLPVPSYRGRGNSQARFLGCRDAADVRKWCEMYQLPIQAMIEDDSMLLNWRMEIGSGCWCNLILCPQLPSTFFAACSSLFIHFHPVSSFLDCQATGFGGWPWPSDSLAHDRHRQRFAQYADGRCGREANAWGLMAWTGWTAMHRCTGNIWQWLRRCRSSNSEASV